MPVFFIDFLVPGEASGSYRALIIEWTRLSPWEWSMTHFRTLTYLTFPLMKCFLLCLSAFRGIPSASETGLGCWSFQINTNWFLRRYPQKNLYLLKHSPPPPRTVSWTQVIQWMLLIHFCVCACKLKSSNSIGTFPSHHVALCNRQIFHPLSLWFENYSKTPSLPFSQWRVYNSIVLALHMWLCVTY